MPDDNFSPQENMPLFEQRSNELVAFLNSLIEDPQFHLERRIEITSSTIDDYRDLQVQLRLLHDTQWLKNHYYEVLVDYPELGYDTFMQDIVSKIDYLRDKIEISDKQYQQGVAVVELVIVGVNVQSAYLWAESIREKVRDLEGEYLELVAKPLQSESFKIKCSVTFKN